MLATAEYIKSLCLSFAEHIGFADTQSLSFSVDITKDMAKGDLYTNFALATAKQLGKNPIAVAVDLAQYLDTQIDKTRISKVEVVGGYVNFWIVLDVKTVDKVSHTDFTGKKIAYEYTDPNPMKEFHIGHLMANTIGESISRLGQLAGAEVRRYSYQGDTGRHLAVTLWGVRFLEDTWPDADSISITDKVKFLGRAYVAGSAKLGELKALGEDSEEYTQALKEVESMNQKVYDRTDEEVNVLYDQGREWSLEKFEELYAILGTTFNHYFFESVTGPIGRDLVLANMEHFAKGENGAIVFEGEKYDLHTRVFINGKGLPTYEAKEIGLAKVKYDVWKYDKSFVVTANEQQQALTVVLKALSFVMPEVAAKNGYIFNGMMKFVGMKMSSRTGKIVAGDELIETMMKASEEKMKEREISPEERKDIAEKVAVAAIKFTILKQNFRKDIIFDPEKALALEGDSGPYIQYTGVRIQSLIKKAATAVERDGELDVEAIELSRMLMRFEHVCYQAVDEYAPQHVAQFLIELASKFNSFYANTKIIVVNEQGDISAQKNLIELCKVTYEVIEKGLWILGIKTVEKM